MPKKIFKRRKRRTFRRKRRSSRAAGIARRQQRAALTYVHKRYTKVFTLDARVNAENAFKTVSLIGGKNAADPANTLTLFSVNQDN